MRKLAFMVALALAPSTARADFADHFARITDVPYDKVPSRGHSRALLIPIEVAGFPPLDMPTLRTFFGSGDGGFTDYYGINSRGMYDVEVDVVDPVQYDHCPLPVTQFPNCSVDRGDPSALDPAIDVLRDALSQVAARGVNFNDYDINGALGQSDGTIDGFLFLTNTPFGGIALPVFEFNDGDNLDGGIGGPFILNGVQVPYVAVAGEYHVLLHEFGHLLGFTDIYDEDDAAGGVDFSLMGNWDYDDNPPLLDAESRYRIGWTPTIDVDRSATVRVSPAELGSPIYKVGNDPEYFLIENRGPGARTDRDMTSRGIAIYHVDRTAGPKPDQGGFVDRLLDCVECDEYHPYILNEVARGAFRWISTDFDASQELFQPGDSLGVDSSGQVFSATHAVASTNFYDGGPSGIDIAVVDQSGSDYDVKVTVPPGTPACQPQAACPAGYVCTDEQCLDAGASTSGSGGKSGGCASGEGVGWLALLAALHFLLKRASKAALAFSDSLSALLRSPSRKSK